MLTDLSGRLSQRYMFVAPCGAGGVGTVLKVYDRITEKTVALKILEHVSDEGRVLFIEEFRTLSRLHHSTLVDVYDFGILPGGDPYFTMEFFDGVPIDKAFEAIAPERRVERFASTAIDMLEGLAYVHSAGTVHGDIKPSNILVAEDALRILDFGLSSLIKRDKGISGTIEYMAPELVGGSAATPLSDIYALGALWFELLTGAPPFTGAPEQVLRGHLHELAPAIDPSAIGAPPALGEVIARMLAKEPHRRPQRCDDIIRSLHDAFGAPAHPHARLLRAWIPGVAVGRDADRARVAAWETRTRENGRAIRVAGPRGVGATRFVREIAVDQMVRNTRVTRIDCTERTTVRECAASILGDADVRAGSIEEYAALAAERLAEQSALGPAVLVADDVDRAERSVKSFLHDVIERTKERPGLLWLIVDRAPQPLASVYDEELVLGGLDPASAAQLLHERYGEAAFVHALAARAVELTGGIVGMMLSLLHGLERDGVLAPDGAAWRCSAEMADIRLPEDLGAALRKSFGLDVLMAEPGTGDVLRAVAFAPEEATASVLEHVVQTGPGGVRRTLERLREAGILESMSIAGAADERYVFSSAPLRDAAAALAEGQRTRNIHRALATALRALGRPATVYAPQMFLAGDPHAVAVLEEAGDLYRFQFAARQAAQCYGDAVTAARRANAPPATIGTLLLKTAAAAGMDGDRTAEGEAVQDAILVAAAADDPTLTAKTYLRESEYFTATGDLARAERSADRARTAAHEAHDDALEARSAAALAISFQRRGDAQKFLEHARAAVAMFRHATMLEDAASIQLDIGFTHALFLNQPERALEEFEESKAGFEQAGAPRGVARAVGSIGLAQYMLGRYEDSLRSLAHAHELFVAAGDVRGQTSALANLARSLLVLRRYSDAIERSSAAIALAMKTRDRFAEQRALETLGAAYDRVGQHERARDALARAYALAQEIGNRAAEASSLQLIGTVLLHRGQYDLAQRSLEQARDLADTLNETEARITVRLWLADLAVRRPVPDAAAAKARIVEAETMLAAGGRHGRESALLQLRAETALLENNLVDARRFAGEAIRAVADHPESDEEPHNVWLTHFRVFERSGDYATAKQSLDRAYALLVDAADAIRDEQLRRTYLENIPEHAAIVDAFRRMKAPPLNVMPAANELMLRRLYDISRALNSALDLDTVLNRLVDNALEVLHAERGLIFLHDESDNALRLSIARNVDAGTIDDASKISEGILNDVFARGKPVVTLNAGGDPRFRERASVVNFHLTTVFCVPLMLRERIIGTLYVDSRRAPGAEEDKATTVEFLEAFANLAAIAIDNARMHEQLREENRYLRKEVEERYAFENIIGAAPAMKRVYELMRGALRGDSPVMIEGESGTGKELVARAIHFNSTRKAGKFVAVDCGAVPETLLDSELFGHKKGAFTGAITDKVGLFEEANRGTIFLDEITNTGAAFQAKLLRVIQEGEFRRVGDTAARTVDVRVIAATNKVLQQEIRAGRFREDLYYRLNVIPIHLPALRERVEDVPFLVDFFVKRYAERLGSPVRGVSGELMRALETAPWHGNVRELENTVHRMLVYASGETLSTKDLPPEFLHSSESPATTVRHPVMHRHATIDEMQAQHISEVLRTTDGNKTAAAKVLGLKRTTLIERMKRLGMM